MVEGASAGGKAAAPATLRVLRGMGMLLGASAQLQNVMAVQRTAQQAGRLQAGMDMIERMLGGRN